MRAYLLFEFVSIFSVNMTSLIRLKFIRDLMVEIRDQDAEYHNFSADDTIGEDALETLGIKFWYERDTINKIIEGIIDLFLSMRHSFIFLVVFDAYNILCRPFDFQEYAKMKNICKRYAIALSLCCLFHLISIAQMLALAATLFQKTPSMGINRAARTAGVRIANDVCVCLFQSIIVAASVKVCRNIKMGLEENDNEFGTGSRLITMHRMSCILSGLLAAMAVANLSVKISRFQKSLSWKLEAWIEMVKAIFDGLIGIVIIGLFFYLFPRLRPTFRIKKDDDSQRGPQE